MALLHVSWSIALRESQGTKVRLVPLGPSVLLEDPIQRVPFVRCSDASQVAEKEAVPNAEVIQLGNGRRPCQHRARRQPVGLQKASIGSDASSVAHGVRSSCGAQRRRHNMLWKNLVPSLRRVVWVDIRTTD